MALDGLTVIGLEIFCHFCLWISFVIMLVCVFDDSVRIIFSILNHCHGVMKHILIIPTSWIITFQHCQSIMKYVFTIFHNPCFIKYYVSSLPGHYETYFHYFSESLLHKLLRFRVIIYDSLAFLPVPVIIITTNHHYQHQKNHNQQINLYQPPFRVHSRMKLTQNPSLSSP